MDKKKFLITISTDAEGFNESVKEALNSAIENEAQDNYESPLFDCRFSVKEISDMEHFEMACKQNRMHSSISLG